MTVLEGKYQYVQVIDDTGSVFIGIDQNNAAKSEKIMQILYTSYPVVLIIALFMVTTGMILWFAVSLHKIAYLLIFSRPHVPKIYSRNQTTS